MNDEIGKLGLAAVKKQTDAELKAFQGEVFIVKKTLQKAFNDSSFWIDVCETYAVGTLALLLHSKWYIWAMLAVFAGIIALKKEVAPNHINASALKKIKTALNTAKKIGDPAIMYNTLDKVLLPELRKALPQKLFKYYPLREDETYNEHRLDTLKSNAIWSSVCSQLNDPFECQYMYMESENFKDEGFPSNAKTLWDKIMDNLRRRI